MRSLKELEFPRELLERHPSPLGGQEGRRRWLCGVRG